jgi:hypothetical protein
MRHCTSVLIEKFMGSFLSGLEGMFHGKAAVTIRSSRRSRAAALIRARPATLCRSPLRVYEGPRAAVSLLKLAKLHQLRQWARS